MNIVQVGASEVVEENNYPSLKARRDSTINPRVNEIAPYQSMTHRTQALQLLVAQLVAFSPACGGVRGGTVQRSARL